MYKVSETVLPIYINGQCPIIKTCSDVTLNLSIIHLWPLSIDLWSSPFYWDEQIIYRKTRENVGSSLSWEFLFFLQFYCMYWCLIILI